ncbi:MAG: hypothetical protein KAJ19_03605 [Gammaproteobacteria bacterium]|nr:hypothetical protein [Gammaproteobacteria bacterium]
MSIDEKTITVSSVMRAIADKAEEATRDYYVAKGQEDYDKAGRMAEVKWCLAELKMDIVDLVINQ